MLKCLSGHAHEASYSGWPLVRNLTYLVCGTLPCFKFQESHTMKPEANLYHPVIVRCSGGVSSGHLILTRTLCFNIHVIVKHELAKAENVGSISISNEAWSTRNLAFSREREQTQFLFCKSRERMQQ